MKSVINKLAKFGAVQLTITWLDDRVWTEVGDNDIVVVAADARYSKYVWDASAVDSKWTS